MKTNYATVSNLHYLEISSKNLAATAKKKLIYFPGMSGTAEVGVELLKDFENVDGVAVSLRGRGKSRIHDGKFNFQAHAQDVFEFLTIHGTEPYFLHCYSLSTAFAIQALAQKGCPQPQGFIIGDYPARYSKQWKLWLRLKGIRQI